MPPEADPTQNPQAQTPLSGQPPEGQVQTPAQSPSSQEPSPQSQEPAWLASIADENLRQEARTGWMQHADYTKKTQELAKERKNFEDTAARLKQYDEWYKTQYVPFATQLQPHWAEVQKVLSGQQPASQAAPVNPQDPFDNWEVLTPSEQAAKMAEHVNNTYVAKALEEQQAKLAETFQAREQYYQNYLKLLTDGFTRKLNEPDLDLEAYMQNAVKVQGGQIDPMEMAYRMTTESKDRARMEKEWYERGKADRDQELQNQSQNPGALGHETTPVFRATPMKRPEIQQSVQQIAAKNGIPWN